MTTPVVTTTVNPSVPVTTSVQTVATKVPREDFSTTVSEVESGSIDRELDSWASKQSITILDKCILQSCKSMMTAFSSEYDEPCVNIHAII